MTERTRFGAPAVRAFRSRQRPPSPTERSETWRYLLPSPHF
jgi:hypothetical protein